MCSLVTTSDLAQITGISGWTGGSASPDGALNGGDTNSSDVQCTWTGPKLTSNDTPGPDTPTIEILYCADPATRNEQILAEQGAIDGVGPYRTADVAVSGIGDAAWQPIEDQQAQQGIYLGLYGVRTLDFRLGANYFTVRVGGVSGDPEQMDKVSGRDRDDLARLLIERLDGAPANSTATPRAPTTTTPTLSTPTKHLTVTGQESGQSLTLTIWGDSKITNCYAHAYGEVVTFLNAHPCASATRKIATYDLNGSTVVISMIYVSFSGNSPDGDETTPDSDYNLADQLVHLENAAGTGGMNDLLRERVHVPGAPGRIPSKEAFWVEREDGGVWIYDAFFAGGGTINQDPKLLALEQDLYGTPFDHST